MILCLGYSPQETEGATDERGDLAGQWPPLEERMGMCVRTIGIGRARVKIGIVNLACNLRRYVWQEGRKASA